MRALVVFCDGGEPAHPLAFMLRPGFRHCFVAVLSGDYWLLLDGKRGVPVVKALAAGDFDLAGHYRACGLTVVETEQGENPLRTLVIANNCVGLVVGLLCLRTWAITPYQLYRHLMRKSMQILPGFGGSDVPDPPPPPPKDTDPAIKESQDKLRLAEKRRKGRAAAILTGPEGDLGSTSVARPEARGATLLGE